MGGTHGLREDKKRQLRPACIISKEGLLFLSHLWPMEGLIESSNAMNAFNNVSREVGGGGHKLWRQTEAVGHQTTVLSSKFQPWAAEGLFY